MLGLKIKIYGRVQGVGFRFFAQKLAKELNLVGLARNEKDGSVYIEVFGEENNLKEFLKECYRGPVFARLEKVEFNFKEVEEIPYTDFELF